jgi:SPP1 gp7 family putative phage head morphogenesis protein
MGMTLAQLRTLSPVRKRRSLRPMKGIKPNMRTELWYKNELLRLVRFIATVTQEALLPILKNERLYKSGMDSVVIGDGVWDNIGNVITRLANNFGAMNSTAKRMAELAARRSFAHVDESLKRALQQTIGIDIAPVLGGANMSTVMEKAIVANTNLIKSIPEQYMKQVQDMVQLNVKVGGRYEDVKEKLLNLTELTETRAKLIARDQVSKMNGAFNQARQQSLGIKKYTWSTSNDERVRESHKHNNGKVFDWDNPPETGHPGEDIQCRCTAIPYIDLDAEEAALGIT